MKPKQRCEWCRRVCGECSVAALPKFLHVKCVKLKQQFEKRFKVIQSQRGKVHK